MYVKDFAWGMRVLDSECYSSCVTLSRLLIAPDLFVYLPVEGNSPLL